MNEFKEELIQAIIYIASTTNMTVRDCIDEAIEILRIRMEVMK